MDYTLTINLSYLLWIALIAVALYVYIKDNSDDHLTQMRHNVEMRKEWFRMLAEQRTKNPKWPNEWTRKS
jgi:hypothetical protein